MKPLVVASNMFQERPRLERWFDCFEQIADAGILIVDSGSEDWTIEYARGRGAKVFVDDIIRKEGYGPARNQLRQLAKEYWPDAHWLAYFDADETISEKDLHKLRFLKDYLIDAYDVIAFPRIDWKDEKMKEAANIVEIAPDWQSRMTRLASPLVYVRKLHEQIMNHTKLYMSISNPKINHFHRSTKEKRDFIGKLCAHLHMQDREWGHTYPEHPKESHYRKLLNLEGL